MHDVPVAIYRLRKKKKAREYALVLHSVGISADLRQEGGEFLLVVAGPLADAARQQLERYEAENKGWPPRDEALPRISDGINGSLIYCALLFGFYMLQSNEYFGLDWLAAGRTEARAIRSGELWRPFTALSLHSGMPHLLSNMLWGGVFGALIAQFTGSGLAWLGVLLAGGLGNWLNAYLQAPEHRSIGASTAVFGALGILMAAQWLRRSRARFDRLRRLTPLVVGLFLLAWFGFPNPEGTDLFRRRIDVLAHCTGLLAGLGLGAFYSLWIARREVRPLHQRVCTALTLALLAGSWMLAFRV